MTIQLSSEEYSIIKGILRDYPYQFYVFGSRAKGTARKFSDLDMCYQDKIPASEIALLETKFIESDLPFKVDLIDFNQIDDSFKKLITPDLIAFP